MAREKAKVFVSYSHKDSAWKERFATILNPVLTGPTEVSWWEDQRLKPSDDWHLEIQRALNEADLYVCMVSPDFLASSYIKTDELPKMLRRRLAGHADIACLYIRESLVDRDEAGIDFRLENGTPQTVKLTRYQGLNAPGSPIASILTDAAQDSALVEAAHKLLDLLKNLPGRKAPPAARAEPQDRYPLRVQLQWQDEDVICSYYDSAQLLMTRHYDGQPYRDILQTWRRLEHTQLSEPQFTDALYRLLFGVGDEDCCNQLLQQIADASDNDRPTQFALRVRLYSDDPQLRSLPWYAASYDGQSLLENQWVFELQAGPAKAGYSNEPSIILRHPLSTVVLDPGLSDKGKDSGSMLVPLLERLMREFEKPRPRHFHSWRELRDQSSELSAGMLYFIGRASEQGGRVLLHFQDGEREERVPASELISIPSFKPKVLFLNLLREQPIDVQALCAMLGGRIPVVLIQQAEPVRREELECRAVDWLRDWQELGGAPTAAFHRKGYWCQSSFTAYESFQTRRLKVQRVEKDLAILLLNRHRQREAISNALRGTIDNADARLLCALVCAETGNLIERFPDKLMKTLDSAEGVQRLAIVESIRLSWPAKGIEWTVAALEEAVKHALDCDPKLALDRVLEKRRPSSPPGQSSVLLLHWPVLRHWPGTEERKVLVDFWTLRLAPKCPKNLRVLALLLFEVGESEHQAVADFTEDLTIEHTMPAFGVVEVDPLDRVKRGDLVKYLSRYNGSRAGSSAGTRSAGPRHCPTPGRRARRETRHR